MCSVIRVHFRDHHAPITCLYLHTVTGTHRFNLAPCCAVLSCVDHELIASHCSTTISPLHTMAFCSGPALPGLHSNTARSHVNPQSRPRPRTVLRASAGGDLLVVGAGALGVRAARLWRESHPDAAITCATWSDERHEAITDEGFTPTLAADLDGKYANVLFCAPPSKAGDSYPEQISKAGSLATDNFVFTSSTAVYKDAPSVTETSELNDSARAQRLLKSEDKARKAGGRVVRLGGLYDAVRGPHAAWLRRGTCAGCEDGILNMLHYDDAASIAVATLSLGQGDDTYIAVDGTPITRLEICESALQHFRFDHFPLPPFGNDMKSVKVIDCSWTKNKLAWQPKWKSFVEFMQLDHDAIMNDTPIPGMSIPQCEMAKSPPKDELEMEHPAVKAILASMSK